MFLCSQACITPVNVLTHPWLHSAGHASTVNWSFKGGWLHRQMFASAVESSLVSNLKGTFPPKVPRTLGTKLFLQPQAYANQACDLQYTYRSNIVGS